MAGVELRIRIAGEYVGSLHASGGDFPWMRGTLHPSPSFASLGAYLRPYHATATHLDLSALAAIGGVASAEAVVEDPTSAEPTFLHALVLHADGTAGLRIGIEPLGEDE